MSSMYGGCCKGVFVVADKPGLILRHFVEYPQLFVKNFFFSARLPSVRQALAVAVDVENLLNSMV